MNFIFLSFNVHNLMYYEYNKSSPKSSGKSHISTSHGREWTHPLHVLTKQCPLQQTSPITQLPVCYIHTTQMDTWWQHIAH